MPGRGVRLMLAVSLLQAGAGNMHSVPFLQYHAFSIILILQDTRKKRSDTKNPLLTKSLQKVFLNRYIDCN